MDDLQREQQGWGPLLERDYWAVIENPRGGPEELADLVARHFRTFPPPDLVAFHRSGRSDEGPLQVGDELEVHIKAAGRFGVRVIHRDKQSLTVATLPGHPEAGRITFGAYRNAHGDVLFHIRSRARASSRTKLLGFLAAGDPMQTNTWSDFVNRVAGTFGDGVRGVVHAEKRKVEPETGDAKGDRPTYRAEGG